MTPGEVAPSEPTYKWFLVDRDMAVRRRNACLVLIRGTGREPAPVPKASKQQAAQPTPCLPTIFMLPLSDPAPLAKVGRNGRTKSRCHCGSLPNPEVYPQSSKHLPRIIPDEERSPTSAYAPALAADGVELWWTAAYGPPCISPGVLRV